MKAVLIILLVMVLFPISKADDALTVEKFKQLTYEEQLKAFDQASPDIKSKLHPILLHNSLLRDFGGEDGLKRVKEGRSIDARDLGPLVKLFDDQWRLGDLYMGQVVAANEQAGLPYAKQVKIAEELDSKYRAPMEKGLPAIEHLVFTLAVSPEALEVTKKAQALSDRITSDLHFGEAHPAPVTKKEFDEINKEVEDIHDQLKKLPTLSPEQIQKQYDAIPDEKVRVGLGPWG